MRLLEVGGARKQTAAEIQAEAAAAELALEQAAAAEGRPPLRPRPPSKTGPARPPSQGSCHVSIPAITAMAAPRGF